jgi:hypothetical protein
VRVEVSDPNFVEDLMASLRSAKCVVVRTSAVTIDVRRGWAIRDEASKYELDGYLWAWEARHPGVSATRVG